MWLTLNVIDDCFAHYYNENIALSVCSVQRKRESWRSKTVCIVDSYKGRNKSKFWDVSHTFTDWHLTLKSATDNEDHVGTLIASNTRQKTYHSIDSIVSHKEKSRYALKTRNRCVNMLRITLRFCVMALIVWKSRKTCKNIRLDVVFY